MGMTGLCRVLMEKPEERRLLGRLRLILEYNIEMDLEEIEWGDVECIDLALNKEK
jgi:hypothetical protein